MHWLCRVPLRGFEKLLCASACRQDRFFLTMNSHGPVSAAVVLCFAWSGLAVVNNMSLKKRPGWEFAELTTFCWGTVSALRAQNMCRFLAEVT